MERDELIRERDETIERYGPWSAQNVHLGQGVYTMGSDRVLATERNIQRTLQLVSDLAGGELSGLRVLDLGAYECGFAAELAAHGAQVTAVEVRDQHVAKGELAKRVLGLDNLTIVEGDARALRSVVSGDFDVVLCLGLVYHLAAADALALLRNVAGLARRFALIETQVSLSAATRVEVDGVEYWGRTYAEDEHDPGSGVKLTHAFWFTHQSLLRALREAGFTSAAEIRSPFVPEIAAFQDHLTMLAIKGPPVPVRVAAWDGALTSAVPVPEKAPRVAHPSQGWRYRLGERIARARGGGMAGIFPRG